MPDTIRLTALILDWTYGAFVRHERLAQDGEQAPTLRQLEGAGQLNLLEAAGVVGQGQSEQAFSRLHDGSVRVSVPAHNGNELHAR